MGAGEGMCGLSHRLHINRLMDPPDTTQVGCGPDGAGAQNVGVASLGGTRSRMEGLGHMACPLHRDGLGQKAIASSYPR